MAGMTRHLKQREGPAARPLGLMRAGGCEAERIAGRAGSALHTCAGLAGPRRMALADPPPRRRGVGRIRDLTLGRIGKNLSHHILARGRGEGANFPLRSLVASAGTIEELWRSANRRRPARKTRAMPRKDR